MNAKGGKRRNVKKLLREFACLCALDVAHLWDMPPVVREYLTTQNEELRAAARDAACAAWAAAGAAARDAAWDAQRKRFNQMVKRAFR